MNLIIKRLAIVFFYLQKITFLHLRQVSTDKVNIICYNTYEVI
nr:MAG TPA: hypothetical protein [Caudoviricetes sp.]